MTDLCIIPAGSGTEGYVELGSRGATGTVFRKHILNLGPLHYRGKVFNLDGDWYARLARNFENGVSMVQAPVADAGNRHTEDPLRNAGEVIGIERDGDKVYTVVDVRDPAVAKALKEKRIMGASAMLSMNYCVDTKTEIFTRRGWLKWDEVEQGDTALAVNPETGLAEWSEIESVFRAMRHELPMISVEARGHSSLTTRDHRWLVQDRSGQWAWTTTEQMHSSHYIRLGVQGAAATEAKYTDEFVELAAWFFTEGNFQEYQATLAQSYRVNPAYCERIERCLRTVAEGEWRHSQRENGVRIYHLRPALRESLRAVMPGKVPTPEFLTSLTQAQLELFIRTCVDGDGNRKGSQQFFAQHDDRRMRAFEYACVLAGQPVSVSGPQAVLLRASRKRLRECGTWTEVAYTGVIWCPTLRHHNWLARRNGKTYFTGNTDTRSGKKVGPALLHHCFTNRPHVLDLEPYEEIVAATADSADMDFDSPIVLATEEQVPELTKDELLAQLKDKHGIDVAALTHAAEARVDLSAVADALRDSGTLSLSGEQLTPSDVVGAIVELNAQNQKLGTEVAKLTKKDAVRTVEGYIGDGRLLPKSRERAVEILLSATPEDLDDFLAPEDAPYIRMGAQSGTQGDGDEGGKQDMDVAAETERLASQARELRDGKKKPAAAGRR